MKGGKEMATKKKNMKKGMKKDSMMSMKSDSKMSKMGSGMKSMDKGMCSCHHGKCWSWLWGDLGAIAFILFLITVWPGLMSLVHRIHWGWFLGATVILCVVKWTMYKRHMSMCM